MISAGACRGVVISTRSGEIVTAPADGWIAFAGAYRSFERLLIINAGDDYYVMIVGHGRMSPSMSGNSFSQGSRSP